MSKLPLFAKYRGKYICLPIEKFTQYEDGSWGIKSSMEANKIVESSPDLFICDYSGKYHDVWFLRGTLPQATLEKWAREYQPQGCSCVSCRVMTEMRRELGYDD